MSAKPGLSPTSSHLAPLSLWLALQLLALCLPTLHIPLSDEFPRPVERLAIHEMLAVQIVASAMLFPMLFTSAATTTALVASTWPFLQLAAMLSATPTPRLLSAALFLAMWMIALAISASTLKSQHARLRAVALATSLALAGPLLWYLHHEFSESAIASEKLIAMNPLLSVFALLDDAERSTGVWVFISALLALSLAASLLLRRRRVRHDNLSTSHPQSLSTAPRTPPDF